jgi:hypothetical protein
VEPAAGHCESLLLGTARACCWALRAGRGRRGRVADHGGQLRGGVGVQHQVRDGGHQSRAQGGAVRCGPAPVWGAELLRAWLRTGFCTAAQSVTPPVRQLHL